MPLSEAISHAVARSAPAAPSAGVAFFQADCDHGGGARPHGGGMFGERREAGALDEATHLVSISSWTLSSKGAWTARGR